MTNEEFNEHIRVARESVLLGVAEVLKQQASVWRDTPECVQAIRGIAEQLDIKLPNSFPTLAAKRAAVRRDT